MATSFARRGAVVIDADQLAREVVAPGTLAYEAIVARFTRRVVKPDGALDRSALAAIVFNDDDAFADLNDMVHPFVRERAGELVQQHRDTDDIVILMVPLLVESARYPTDVVLVVDCKEEVAVERAVAQRGWTPKDVRRRMAAQASREVRNAAADLLIDNSGSLQELDAQLDRAWRWLEEQRAQRSARQGI